MPHQHPPDLHPIVCNGRDKRGNVVEDWRANFGITPTRSDIEIDLIFELKDDKPQVEKNSDVLFKILGYSKMEQCSLTHKVFLVHLPLI